ncbi:hypothetical protein B0E42_01980 [Pseudomonas sp. A25(2017)]|nr:hypothetical protein B0E42_01980 [Pseudomonas sp. A25(2017)]
MAQRGYPGIHAGMPTTQYLRSASVVNGAPQIKIKSEAAFQPTCLSRSYTHPICGSKACSRGGLPADLALPVVHPSDLWEQSLLARRPSSRPVSPGRTPIRSVGAKLAREAAFQPTCLSRSYTHPICGSKACSRGGLPADLSLPVVHPSDLWEQSLLARRPDSRPGSSGRTPIRSVGAKLAREAAFQPTCLSRSYSDPIVGVCQRAET